MAAQNPTAPAQAAPPRVVQRANVVNPPGSVDLGGYPLLVYGPRPKPENGMAPPVVRVASASIPVAEILEARDRDPAGNLAQRFRLAPEEVEEVLRWAADPDRPGDPARTDA